MLNREAILANKTLESELVSVPEWGGEVRVRAMTGAERDRLEIACAQRRKAGKSTRFRASLAVQTVCDDDLRPIFVADDAEIIDKMPAAGLGRVADVAMRLSGISEEDAEDLEKN